MLAAWSFGIPQACLYIAAAVPPGSIPCWPWFGAWSGPFGLASPGLALGSGGWRWQVDSIVVSVDIAVPCVGHLKNR
jgi:hypothetical protein